MSFRRTILASALALAALPAVAANDHPYSQTVFFGDSLTDSGHFRPTLVQLAGPTAASGGRFTTNPGLVWSEFLADFYGTQAVSDNQGGTDYAVGGARVGTNSTVTLAPGVTLPVPSLATQVNAYLTANGGHPHSNALYPGWGGPDHLFADAAGRAGPGPIPSAVTAQVGLVGQLEAAGARYVLVPTLPDMGLTPSARAQGAASQALFTQLATTYNTALFSGLAAQNLRVIPLDTFHLFQEVVANPAAFGLSNVTGTACQPQITAQSLTCSPTTYVNANAPSTYAFADGVHPTTAGHEILADYAVSMLEAPRQIAALSSSASSVGRARADRVVTRAIGAQPEAGTHWWADVRGDFQKTGDDSSLYEGVGPALTGGVDWTSGALTFGGFLGWGRSELDFGRNAGDFDQTDLTLGGHAAWRSGSAWVDGQLSYSQLDYDINRDIALGNGSRRHHGSTDGTNLSAGVQAGWDFEAGGMRHGPVIGLLSQTIEIDGFNEDQAALSTSLSYPDQDFDSLIGTVGWQVAYTGNQSFVPYARATYDHEFEDMPAEAFATSQSLTGSQQYAVPGLSFDQDYGTLLLGARTKVFGLDANVGVSATVGEKQGDHTTLFATVGSSF